MTLLLDTWRENPDIPRERRGKADLHRRVTKSALVSVLPAAASPARTARLAAITKVI
jgi:hypothetical protein